MPRNYEREFKKKIVRLHLEQGRTYASITQEFDVSKASISKWCSEFSKECHQMNLILLAISVTKKLDHNN